MDNNMKYLEEYKPYKWFWKCYQALLRFSIGVGAFSIIASIPVLMFKLAGLL